MQAGGRQYLRQQSVADWKLLAPARSIGFWLIMNLQTVATEAP